MQDSKSRALRIFLTLVAAFVPIIVAIPLLLLMASQSGAASPAAVSVLGAAGALAGLVVGAAVASRLYRAYAEAMKSG